MQNRVGNKARIAGDLIAGRHAVDAFQHESHEAITLALDPVHDLDSVDAYGAFDMNTERRCRCRGVRRLGRRNKQFGRHASHPCARSEEHTSALQSLMRLSYAVFCLTQKTNYKLRSYKEKTHKTNDTITSQQ